MIYWLIVGWHVDWYSTDMLTEYQLITCWPILDQGVPKLQNISPPLYPFNSQFKLITNRWAWALVLTKLVEPGNALAWGGGIHGNPASGLHQAPSHWTIQWNTYDQYFPGFYLKREGGMGRNQSTKGTQTASYCNNTLRRTASKQLHICHEVPRARGIGSPLV